MSEMEFKEDATGKKYCPIWLNLDIDSKNETLFKLQCSIIEYIIKLYYDMGKISEAYKRTSSNGKGKHYKICLKLPPKLKELGKHTENLMLLRWFLFDDINRIASDILRLNLYNGEHGIMVLFDCKIDSKGEHYAGEWELITPKQNI